MGLTESKVTLWEAFTMVLMGQATFKITGLKKNWMHKIKDLDGVLMMLEGARTQNASFSLDRQLEIKRQQYRSVMENEAKKIYILSKYTSRKWGWQTPHVGVQVKWEEQMDPSGSQHPRGNGKY